MFGLPLEVISNLSDTSEHLAPDEPLNEKMVFVGGRYQGKYMSNESFWRLCKISVDLYSSCSCSNTNTL